MKRVANCAAQLFLALAASLLLQMPARAVGEPTVLVLGDSLSAEYGLTRGTGWVSLLAGRLESQGINARKYNVVNASISGETSIGGRTRLPALLQDKPVLVVIELGANDALRGLPLEQLRANLEAMAKASRDAGARVLIAGMRIPPNYGRTYSERFAQVFAEVAKSQQAALVPFLLDGFAARVEYFLPDRLHPNERAQQKILDNVWPVLAKALADPRRR